VAINMWQHWFDVVRGEIFSSAGIDFLLLFSTIAYAIGVTFIFSQRTRTVRGFMRYLWPRDILTHPSAKADFLFWLSRRLFIPFLVIPLTFSTIFSGHIAYKLLTYVFGVPAHPPGPASPLTLVLFTASMILVYDFSYYCYHAAQHRIPILWELHKVHHSAEVMVGVTKDRIHPIDEIMNRWWDGALSGLAYGAWLFFAIDPVELTIFGISAYVIRQTIIMMDFVRHTHMKVSYGKWLNQVFICPHYHQLHHSVDPRHYDRNFGLAFAIWDRLFGTLMVPKPNEDFEFGLVNREAEDYRSFAKLHVVPLIKIYHIVNGKLRARTVKTSGASTA
jgi:sterol desaturase/sphingolipid hydroxylase (fatty acid hydroxylase superfamily)